MIENELTEVPGDMTRIEVRPIRVANHATISLTEAAGVLGIAVRGRTERPEQKAETP